MRGLGKGRSAAAEGGDAGAVASTTDYGKTASFLAVGVGLTGIITYAYFLIASHTLSKPDYGQITVLWSAVFITRWWAPWSMGLRSRVVAMSSQSSSVAPSLRVTTRSA